MKTGQKRMREPCPRCGRLVAFLYSGRSTTPSTPMRHNCPHGFECIGITGPWGSVSASCTDCDKVLVEKSKKRQAWALPITTLVVLCSLLLSCSRHQQPPVPEPVEASTVELDAEPELVDAGPGEAEAGNPTLSLFATQFDPIDGRTTNITVASGKINGHVIEPGAVFSFNEVVGIRTAKAGYVNAPVLLQGRRTDDLGGGVCQVSSTLHAAAIQGGLVIVERRPHSLVPKYIEPGYDATVAFPASCEVKDAPCGKLDLKIKNPFSFPITIRAEVAAGATMSFPSEEGTEAIAPQKKGMLFVSLEGSDPQMVVEITKQTEPMGRGGRRWVRSGKVLSPGYVKVVQQQGEGYFVRSTATYTKDGQEVRAPFKWFSRYPPVDEVWEVGWSRPADAGAPWPEGR